MKNIFFATMLIFISTTMFAQQPADKIIGTWETIDSREGLRFEIFKSEGKYFGKLLWAYNIYESDGITPKKDFNNPDKDLQNRSRIGMVNVKNLSYVDDNEYTGGMLYNPTDGDTYNLNAELINENQLNFRGYKGLPMFGKTIKFKRIQKN